MHILITKGTYTADSKKVLCDECNEEFYEIYAISIASHYLPKAGMLLMRLCLKDLIEFRNKVKEQVTYVIEN